VSGIIGFPAERWPFPAEPLGFWTKHFGRPWCLGDTLAHTYHGPMPECRPAPRTLQFGNEMAPPSFLGIYRCRTAGNSAALRHFVWRRVLGHARKRGWRGDGILVGRLDGAERAARLPPPHSLVCEAWDCRRRASGDTGLVRWKASPGSGEGQARVRANLESCGSLRLCLSSASNCPRPVRSGAPWQRVLRGSVVRASGAPSGRCLDFIPFFGPGPAPTFPCGKVPNDDTALPFPTKSR